MKKICSAFLFLIASIASHAQKETGIKFEQGLSWQQILAKANAENKYVFVDCYATWCVPCKKMDHEVYPNDSVGNFFNAHFISVKAQLDTSKDDNDAVKNWYADAAFLDHTYKPEGVPTFLFFAPDGKIVYKGLGYQNVNGLIKLARFATDPKRKDFYSQLEDYKNGKKDYAIMPELSKLTKGMMGDKELSGTIARDYKMNYLDKLPDEKLFTRENCQFIGQDFSLVKSSDRIFQLIYEHPGQADTLFNRKGASKKLIDYVIYKEEIENKTWKDGQPVTRIPDWDKINLAINKKYKNCNGDSLVSAAKIFFYKRTKNWKEYVSTVESLMKKYPPSKEGKKFSGQLGGTATLGADSWGLNAVAWDLFLQCNDQDILRKALAWSNLSLQLSDDPNDLYQYYDTKANLLYKLGKKNEAIPLEQKAIETANELLKGAKNPLTDNLIATKEKMEKGVPTWK